MSTLRKVREELAAKQASLHKVFDEAKTGDGSYDFSKISKETLQDSLGDGNLKNSIDIAKRVNEKDAELQELAGKAEALEAAEKAASTLEAREKAISRPPMPGNREESKGREAVRIKSMGELVAEEKAYEAWVEAGCPGGINFSLDDLLPSDMMAKAAAFATLQTKALMSTSSGYAPESTRLPGFVEAVTRPLQLLDIIPMFPTGMPSIKYMEETTRTHAAAETAEGGTFAESTFVFTEKSSEVKKITDSVPVTDEQLEDVAMMQGYLNSRIGFGVRQRLDSQVLIGDATGSNLRGLKNVSGIQTQARGADPAQDAFFKAMTKIRLNGRAEPTHHVMHPTDWQNIRLQRTADGIYIWGSPSETAAARLWGLPVAMADADAAGTGYTGSFLPSWLSIFERKGVDIQLGYVGTQFAEGKRTVRGDMRAAFVVFRPAAFSSVTGL